MEIVGYIAYASLVILAIVWTAGVRTDLGAQSHVTLRAVYFVSSAVIIPAFGVNMAHALWVVPLGCAFSRVIAPMLVRTPVVSTPFVFVAAVFERIVRVGIPRHKIQEARANAICACDIKDGSD
jgi:hypothetical protein